MSITDGFLYFHNDKLGPGVGTFPDRLNAKTTDYFDFQDEVFEFYNLARTQALIRAMKPPNIELESLGGNGDVSGLWTVPDSFYRFGATVMPVPESPGDVSNPAPWYRASDPASAEACGMIVVESSGDGAGHHGRTAVPRGASGSSFTPNRADERVIVCRAIVVGTTPRGADYMYRWIEEQLLDLGSQGPLHWENILFRLWRPDPADVVDYASVGEWAAAGMVKGNRAVSLDPPTIDRLSSEVPNVIQFTFTIALGQPTLVSLHKEAADIPVFAGGASFLDDYKFAIPTDEGDSVVPIVNVGTLAETWDATAEVRPVVAVRCLLGLDYAPTGFITDDTLVSAIDVRPPSGVVTRLDYAGREVQIFDPFVSADSRSPAGDDFYYDTSAQDALDFIQRAAVRRRRVSSGERYIQQSGVLGYGDSEVFGTRPILTYGKESPWSVFFDRSLRADTGVVIMDDTDEHAASYVLVKAHGLVRSDNW